MENAGVGVVVAVITLLLRDGIPQLIALMKARTGTTIETEKDRREAKKEEIEQDRKTEAIQVRELKELVAVLRADGAEFRQQIHDLRDEMNVMGNNLALARAELARALERIASYEEAFEREGKPFRPFEPGVGPQSGRFKRTPTKPPQKETGDDSQ